MADVDIAVGAIAAAAALGGVALTLLGERWRRRWEDRRRWADVKRTACREFLYASRTLYSHVRTLKISGIHQRELRSRLDDLSAKVANGISGPEVQAEMTSLKRDITRESEEHDRLKPLIEPTWARANEASADMVILCSPKLLALASEHQSLIMSVHGESVDALPVPQGYSFIDRTERLVQESQDALRVEIRRELGVDHG